jgi:hypothetical protein
MFLTTNAAHTADTFHFPPYIEVPCYKSLDDRDLKNPPFSTAHIPFGSNLTLRDLQELVRDQKGPGFLVFNPTKIDLMGYTASQEGVRAFIVEFPVKGNTGNKPLEQLEMFIENLYFVLTNAASSKIGNNKNH